MKGGREREGREMNMVLPTVILEPSRQFPATESMKK